MINLPPLHSSKRIDVKTIPEVLKTWQLGQILESRARTSSNAQGELQIQVGSHLVDARSKSPILAGEELQLQVARLGAEPLLKIISPPIQTDPVTLFLRQAVPQPGSIKALLNLTLQLLPSIQKLDTTEFSELKSLSRHLGQLVQLPTKQETLAGNEIKQFLQKSGFNLELQILNQQIPEKNLKLELIQVRQLIEPILKSVQQIQTSRQDELSQTIKLLINTNRPAAIATLILQQLSGTDKTSLLNGLLNQKTDIQTLPPRLLEFLLPLTKASAKQVEQLQQWLQLLPALTELRQLIDQSLNTITNNQLQAVQAEADSAFMVLFNLLVAKTPEWIDLFNIRISKEEPDSEQSEHWRVVIQMDLPDLGKIEARLAMVDDQLHTGISSESDITHQLISEHLQLLEISLNNAGFTVATISCHQQTIKPLETEQLSHGPLLDDKA